MKFLSIFFLLFLYGCVSNGNKLGNDQEIDAYHVVKKYSEKVDYLVLFIPNVLKELGVTNVQEGYASLGFNFLINGESASVVVEKNSDVNLVKFQSSKAIATLFSKDFPTKFYERLDIYCRSYQGKDAYDIRQELYLNSLPSDKRYDEWLRLNKEKLSAQTKVARVLNVQLTNLSTGATTGGAQLGSTLGQTNYIDSSNFKSYSASSQVGAGLLGAVVGNMLDAPSVTKYKITYFLQMPDREVKRFEKTQSTETHIPAGVCVEFREPSYLEVVNQNNCVELKK